MKARMTSKFKIIELMAYPGEGVLCWSLGTPLIWFDHGHLKYGRIQGVLYAESKALYELAGGLEIVIDAGGLHI